jgi:hypothetical protein
MRLNEFTSPLNKYLITVKIDGVSVKSTIEAQSQSQASLLLGKIFGKKNVQSICSIAKNESKNNTSINLDEQTSTSDLAKLWQMVSQSVFQAVENERRNSEEVERLRAAKPKKSHSEKSSSRFLKPPKKALAKSIPKNAAINHASNSRSTTQQPVPSMKSVQTSPQFKTVSPPTPTIASPQPSKAKKTSAQDLQRQKVQSKTLKSKPQTVLPTSSSVASVKAQNALKTNSKKIAQYDPNSVANIQKQLDPLAFDPIAKKLTN